MKRFLVDDFSMLDSFYFQRKYVVVQLLHNERYSLLFNSPNTCLFSAF